ncbi:carbohydrate kinase family protein [Microvirga makkahensis]|uniref:Carbohydrate kinase n=1 Tax=Microvirga makkahensis TaxID=1128670 RepID=A0A7X3MR70_9HYPH|nr:carbohydrate kinase [Microvirga makkahensis]MXQ11641.1 carbohydrate kinase [Microvirga makkahensis]
MILVCGEALIDLFVGPPSPIGLTAEAVAGGSPFNVAIGIGRLGRAAAFLSTLSEDTFGVFLAGKLAEAGVSPSYLQRCPNPTTLSVVATGPSGEPRYSFYAPDSADRALRPEALPSSLPAEVNAIAAGSYALGVEPIASAIETLLRRESGSRVISLDPNVRPRVVGDLKIYRERFERLLVHATIVKASDEDIHLLYPDADLVSVSQSWLRRGPRLVVVTRGAEGSMAVFGSSRIERPAPRANVVDTVGAGDTFHAGLLSWLDANDLLRPESMAGLTQAQATAALDFAAAAAAIVCTRRGANPPTWEEVYRFMATRA